MRVHKCLLWGCNRLPDETLKYYKLTKSRYNLWLNALGRDPDENLAHSNVICSKHFSETNFFTVNNERKLKVDAVPDINLRTFKTETRPPPSISTGPLQEKSMFETEFIQLKSEFPPDIESPCTSVSNKVSTSSQSYSERLEENPKHMSKLIGTIQMKENAVDIIAASSTLLAVLSLLSKRRKKVAPKRGLHRIILISI